MPYNLVHLQPNFAYRFSKKLQIRLSQDFLWRANKADAFYTSAAKIGVRAGESDASYIGSQVELALNWRPTKQIVTKMHYVYFSAGEVVEDAGGTNQNYFHVGFNYLF